VPELTTADRFAALLEWGDIAEADAVIAEVAAGADAGGEGIGEGIGEAIGEGIVPAWQLLLWRAMRALMDGRFFDCQRLSAEAAERGAAAGEARVAGLATVQLAALRRAQERTVEAEAILRSLVDREASVPSGAPALLALLVGEMGRDGLARQELARLLPAQPPPASGGLAVLYLLAELASSVEAPPSHLELLRRRLSIHADDFAVEDAGSVFYGSVSLALGRLAHASGKPDEAIERLEAAVAAHRRAGAPLLLADTERQLAALLRLRGDDGDWERSVALLSEAVAIYRQLGIDGALADAQRVLARSEGGLHAGEVDVPVVAGVFRREADGWLVGPHDDPVRLRDARGLRDIARLLAVPRRAIHVADMLVGADGRDAPSDPPAGGRDWIPDAAVLDAATRHEYEARLAELAGELVEAERAGDAIRAALARAERDVIAMALSEAGSGGGPGGGVDAVERARRIVGTRIRISLDHIETAQPVVGRHLRTSIRTGTFCSYEPESPVRWAL
jgi:hypothetical protein